MYSNIWGTSDVTCDISLCAGARRGILKLPGVEEDVGLIGIHWQGKFIELVPWNAEVSWEVEPWGRWKVSNSDHLLTHLFQEQAKQALKAKLGTYSSNDLDCLAI